MDDYTPSGKRLKRAEYSSERVVSTAETVASLAVGNIAYTCVQESMTSPTNSAGLSTNIGGDPPSEQCAEHMLGEWQDWQLDTRATEFAAELIQAPFTLCAFGLQKIALRHAFVYDLGETGDNVIITKKSTRRIYDAAYDTCKKRPGMRVLLEGRQGTGKSRSLIYLLQKLLRSNTVVLFLDGRGSN
jgi:ABC-type multidrug transport system fused ATPase/permease subunit